VGDYNVIVMDDLGICEYAFDTPLVVSGVVGVEDDLAASAARGVQLYPNPTRDHFTVDAASFGHLNGSIQVVVLDHMGRSLSSYVMAPGRTSTVISLQQYPTGAYLVKCFNDASIQNFKVIKL
jgi:hypothetical protein